MSSGFTAGLRSLPVLEPVGRFVPQAAQVSKTSGAEPLLAHLIAGDSLEVARLLPASGLRPLLVYIDPPFAVERDFHVQHRGGSPAGEKTLAYTDRWPSLKAYLEFLEEILRSIHTWLDDQGSLLLHCDYRASSHLALLCDEIFGAGDRELRGTAGFRNELIWSYGLGGSSPRSYPKKHDSIFWYTKSERWFFDPPMVPATSNRLAGSLKKAPDVLAIPNINNMAKERTGYPTQKPQALLELLIGAHTRPGELVVDFFSGSGTTTSVAARMGRQALGVDRGEEGVAASLARLLRDGVTVEAFRAQNTAWPEAVAAKWMDALGVAKCVELG